MLEYQLLRWTVINAMPYWSGSPSSNNNIGSNVYIVAFQVDGLCNVAEAEGRAHLKYKIRFRLISNSARLQDFFLYICDFLLGFNTGYLILLCSFSLQKEVVFLMILHFLNRK